MIFYLNHKKGINTQSHSRPYGLRKFKLTFGNKTSVKISFKSTDDINEAVNLQTKSIQGSAWSSSIPNPKVNHTINLPSHIQILITEKRRARANW